MTCEQLRDRISRYLQDIHSKKLLEMLYKYTLHCFLREDREEDEQ